MICLNEEGINTWTMLVLLVLWHRCGVWYGHA
jgi:hypothetical protein